MISILRLSNPIANFEVVSVVCLSEEREASESLLSLVVACTESIDIFRPKKLVSQMQAKIYQACSFFF